MKLISVFACSVSLAAMVACFAQATVLDQASRLEVQGQLTQAADVLTDALDDKSLPTAQRKQLEFELDRLERIRKDFSFTKDELFTALKKSVKHLTADEFEHWVAEGRFDSREIDGQRRFMSSSVSNLFFRYPELNARRIPPKDTTKHDRES